MNGSTTRQNDEDFIDENLSYAFINKFRTLRKSKELISMLDTYIEMYPDCTRALQGALYNRAH